jgi:BirA family transcriptional regulator, biotin operon repressor / biotin---[acetyl-CoA-carboxylase] ligase
MAEPEEVHWADAQHIGRRRWIYDCLDSTNTKALTLASDPSQDGLVIVAHEQSAGRGQYGRSWHAPARSSVLMSVLLFPPVALRRPALLTTWAAVAVSEAILELTGQPAQIKWPNDVLLGGKKVCGILIEQRNSGHPDRPLATVVGIGLNVSQSADMFLQAGLTLAGSLTSQTNLALSTDEVAQALIRQLDAEYARLRHGDFLALERRWRSGLGLLGQPVCVEGLTQRWEGRLVQLTLTTVVLELETKRVLTLEPEAVRHIRAR